MSLRELQRKFLGRRSVRARIGLGCAGLFLVTGGAFVAATYAIIDHSLGPSSSTPSIQAAPPTKSQLGACKVGNLHGTLTHAQMSQCLKFFAEADGGFKG